MSPVKYLEEIVNNPSQEGVEVVISIPGNFMGEGSEFSLNDPDNSIGSQIITLKELITLGTQKNSAMISAELDAYARVRIIEANGKSKTLPLSMALKTFSGRMASNSPQRIIDSHGIKDSTGIKNFYSENWPALYSEFGSLGVGRLLRDKSLNTDLSDFLSSSKNTVRVSPGYSSVVLEAGQSKTVIFSAHNEQGERSNCKTSAFANVNLSYLVNKGLSKYPSLQTMIASDIGVDKAIKNEHIKEGASVLSALKTASTLSVRELKDVGVTMPWVNSESIKRFKEFENIINNNSYPVEDRISWILERQEELGKMKAKDDLNVKDSGLKFASGA